MKYKISKAREEYKAKFERSLGDWDIIRLNLCSLASWRDYVYFSPHFHIIALFEIPQYKNKKTGKLEKYTSADFENETGWQYTNITWKKRKQEEDKEACYKIAKYQLTHMAYIKGKQNITYFGLLSYNKLDKKSIKEKILLDCTCSSPMYRLEADEKRLQYLRWGFGIEKYEINPFSRSFRFIVQNFYYVRHKKEAAKFIDLKLQFYKWSKIGTIQSLSSEVIKKRDLGIIRIKESFYEIVSKKGVILEPEYIVYELINEVF